MRKLADMLSDLPAVTPFNHDPVSPKDMTAILLVSGYNGFGLHTLLSIVRSFPGVYANFLFLSVAEIDSGTFKGIAEIEALKASVEKDLSKYVKITRQHGFPADFRMNVGDGCGRHRNGTGGIRGQGISPVYGVQRKTGIPSRNPFQKVLHNETAFSIQRRLQWNGVATVILPIRVSSVALRGECKGRSPIIPERNAPERNA